MEIAPKFNVAQKATVDCSGLFSSPEHNIHICRYDLNSLLMNKSSNSESKIFIDKSKADVKKIPDCEQFTSGTQKVYFCGKEESGFWSKTIESSPSLVIALLAVVVSIGTLNFMRNQDSRNIVRSIDDDYILRTILSPNIIEPVFQITHNINTELSKIPSLTHHQRNKIEESITAYGREVRAMQVTLESMEIIDPKFRNLLTEALMLLEDAIFEAAYQASLTTPINNQSISREIGSAVNKLVTAVREYQISLLATSQRGWITKGKEIFYNFITLQFLRTKNSAA